MRSECAVFRKNGEDYSTGFLVMLNTWEGAINFRGPGKKLQPEDLPQRPCRGKIFM